MLKSLGYGVLLEQLKKTDVRAEGLLRAEVVLFIDKFCLNTKRA